MRKRISYFCPWVTTREVIRLGFSGFLFSLLLQLCISGEEEKGKILKSRRTTYDNTKTCWLTFWKRFGIIGSTVKGSNWCCWQTKFQLKMLTFEYSSWGLKFYVMIYYGQKRDVPIWLKKSMKRLNYWPQLVKLCLLGPPRLPKKNNTFLTTNYVINCLPILGLYGPPPGSHRGGWPTDPKFF